MPSVVQNDQELVESVFERVATDLGMIIDREVEIDEVKAERMDHRPAGEGAIHISFRLGITVEGTKQQGCLLMPLPDVIAMAGFLMMVSDAEVEEMRKATEIDMPMKEAMLEVGSFVAGACDAVVRRLYPESSSVSSDGCQGVRAGVRPALEYEEGNELVVGRAKARLHEYEAFPVILMLPALQEG